jgi:hypothetical protein
MSHISDALEKCIQSGHSLRALYAATVPDFSTFLKDMIRQNIVDLSALLQADEQQLDICLSSYLAMLWADDGFNVFDVSADLATGLILSNPIVEYNETIDDQLPYNTFMIRIPPGILMNPARNWIRLILVSKSFFEEGNKFVSTLTLSEAADYIQTSTSAGVDLHTLATRSLPSMFVHNFLVWMTSINEHGDEALADKRRVPRPYSKRNERIWPAFWEVGRGVKLHPELIKYARQLATGDTANPQFVQRDQMKVMGHFQHYWCGTGGTQRKRLWKLAYWKGDPTSEHGVGHRYH